MKIVPFTLCLVATALPLVMAPARAADATDVLDQLSLEDLMQIEVTSVSKKPQKLANVAAAVHVISAEDIHLSGANSLPEVLRLAPGIDATRLSGNRWEISARGFAELFAAKLLVLVDGRNALNPAFSGASWQNFQFPLEDIERIEVIRGPAAAIWGSNGINGVINIITKSAAATQGGQAVIGGGTVEGSYARLRWGGQNADGSQFYRVYGSTQHANDNGAAASLGGGGAHDAYGNQSAGFRLDGYLAGGARWDMSADFYDNRSDGLAFMYLPSGTAIEKQTERHHGTILRARYETPFGDGGNLQVQTAYARTTMHLPYILTDRRDTFDLDMQHRFQLGNAHDLVWGVNYRVSSDTIERTAVMWLNVPSRRMNYLGLFAQDEVSLAETLRLTLGLRADHNPISGWDMQPTARLSWNLQANHTLWGALSRAARAPSRADSGFNRNAYYFPAGSPRGNLVPVLYVLQSTDQQSSERLKAAEIGLRSQWAPTLSTDLVAFTHRYDNLLRTVGPAIPIAAGPPVVLSAAFLNGGEMTLNGAELSTDWRIGPAWRLQLAQTWNHVTHVGTVEVEPYGTTPRSITSLRLSWTPVSSVNIDAWLRRTSARPGIPEQPYLQRQARNELDLRLAWRPKRALELSLSGQNLTNGNCDALADLPLVPSTNTGVIPTCQPRALVGQVRIDF
jgi:iron complex outermembrane receptor protein